MQPKRCSPTYTPRSMTGSTIEDQHRAMNYQTKTSQRPSPWQNSSRNTSTWTTRYEPKAPVTLPGATIVATVDLLAGGAIYYRTRIQPTVAQSSIEAECGFMTDSGKAALYIRSILEAIQIEQILPTQIAVNNRGARQMTNAQQPTKRTRHVDIKEIRYSTMDQRGTNHV
jgi:hypothetical protein